MARERFAATSACVRTWLVDDDDGQSGAGPGIDVRASVDHFGREVD